MLDNAIIKTAKVTSATTLVYLGLCGIGFVDEKYVLDPPELINILSGVIAYDTFAVVVKSLHEKYPEKKSGIIYEYKH